MLIVCWSLFGLVWVVGAAYNARHSPSVKRRELPISWILGALLYLVIRFLLPSAWLAAATCKAAWMTWLGMGLLAVSTAFTLYARGVLGTMWSSEPNVRDGHRLRTSGPYRVTRNPIYTGLLGMLLGSGCMAGWGVWLFVFVGVMAIFRSKIAAEEKLMLATFGDEYQAYMNRVPRLLPGLHTP